jgi:hypothetical protein
MALTAIGDCAVVPLPEKTDARGSLGFLEAERHVPFEIRRAFYLYDIPPGAKRGGHAHTRIWQFLIALSGGFDMTLDDGAAQKTIRLDHPGRGLCVPPGIWGELGGFAPGTVCLVLASEYYDETEYIRDHVVFAASKKKRAV